MTGSRRVRVSLALIILVSTICSLWFASAELTNQRYWDERHSLRNIRGILSTGSWKPESAFYPALSHLPQAALLGLTERLYRATGNRLFEILRPGGSFTPTAYYLCRGTSIVYGIGCLLMTYLIGRTSFSRRTGLLASFLLALSPFFLGTATIYKPDPLLLLSALVAFHWAVRATRDKKLWPYLVVGGAVGISAASKQNGALSSIPVIAGTLLWLRDPRRWLWLVAAGLTSLVVFFVFNPFPDLFESYLSMGQRYSKWAVGSHDEFAPIPIHAARLVLSDRWHGPLIGTATWLGLLGLGAKALKERKTWPQPAPAALLVIFVIALPLVCTLVDTYPKDNIFVPLLPFSAMAAAWFLVTAWDFAKRRTGPAAHGWLLGLGWAAILTTTLPSYATTLYYGAIPETTVSAASAAIEKRAQVLAHRTVVSESKSLGIGKKRFRRNLSAPLELRPERLFRLHPAELDLADFEVFPLSSLATDARSFYLDRMERAGDAGVEVFEPKLFARRGPPLVVVSHPWRVQGASATRRFSPEIVPWNDRAKRKLRAVLPRWYRRGQVISLDVAMTLEQARECRLKLGAKELQLHQYEVSPQSPRFMTPRQFLPGTAMPLRFKCPKASLLEPGPRVGVIRWLPGRPPKSGRTDPAQTPAG